MNPSVARALLLLLLPVALSFACSSEPEGTDASDSMDRGPREFVEDDSTFRACVEFVAARCERAASCSGNDRKDQCRREAAATCPDEVFGPGSNFTKAGALGCADEWRSFDCDALRDLEVPACANLAGSLADGEPCLFSSQCQNGCTNQGGTSCGTCAPWASADAECQNRSNVCPGLATCFEGTCVAQVGDEPCEGTCDENEVCAGGECVPPSQSGDECIRGQVGPDYFYECTSSDLICVQNECKPRDTLPDENEPCLVEFNGGMRQTLCRPGLVCSDEETCQVPELGKACVGVARQCGDGQVCVDDICLERLRYRQQGCDDSFTHCEAGTDCQDNVCLGHSSAENIAERCAN